MENDALTWVVGVNLVIWTGLFLYLLRLGKRLGHMEDNPEKKS